MVGFGGFGFGSCRLTYAIAKLLFEEDRVEKVALNDYWNANIFLDVGHFMTTPVLCSQTAS